LLSNFYLENDRTFYGGLLAGVNLAQVDGDDFAGYTKKGFNLGGIVYTRLDANIMLSLEILYVQKGSKAKEPQELSAGYVITDYGINLNYAEVPIMINYVDDHKNNFGGGFSYSRLGTSSEYISTNPAQTFDLNKYPFKKSDYNLVLGGSLHLYKNFYLNGHFQYSLVPIRDKIPQTYTKAPQYNNVVVFRLMYLFM
jgi:hypothetical protein